MKKLLYTVPALGLLLTSCDRDENGNGNGPIDPKPHKEVLVLQNLMGNQNPDNRSVVVTRTQNNLDNPNVSKVVFSQHQTDFGWNYNDDGYLFSTLSVSSAWNGLQILRDINTSRIVFTGDFYIPYRAPGSSVVQQQHMDSIESLGFRIVRTR